MRKITTPKRWLLLLLPVVVLLNVGYFSRPAGDDYFEISKNMDIFGKMYREVHSNYVDDIDPTQFMRTGMDAMLKSLDPYTNYISAAEIEDYRFMSTGQYGGIGAMVGLQNGKICITDPYEGYPAQKAGLRAGDIIVQIDNEKVAENANTSDVRNLLRGQPKTKVRITVRREGVADPISVDVERDDIKILNVPYHGMATPEVGYISLTGFTAGASGEVKAALEDLKKNNAGMKGVILDLRGNPGGLLYEAIDISNLFVSKDEMIVETRGKMEGSLKSYTARNTPVDPSIPLAVLIDRRSASAAEIVSGVMQDLDRGVVIGQRSFGKGLVQTTRPLSYNSQIKITTAKYYTPSGRCIQAIDYSNRNEDGSVGKVPDSLKKEFKTKAGRTVYDGGGVDPDVEVKHPDYHTVTTELIRQGLLFDFATRYRSKHDDIAEVRSFKVDDALYSEFAAYCKERNFSFETRTEKEFTKLKDLMKDEHYDDDLANELKAIETKLSQEKQEDVQAFKAEIAKFLRTEIATRYYYKRGEIEASFDMDPDILAAVQVLNNEADYKGLLNGTVARKVVGEEK